MDKGIQHTRCLVVLANTDDLVNLFLLESATDNDEVLLFSCVSVQCYLKVMSERVNAILTSSSNG